jgi:hypothetical protein
VAHAHQSCADRWNDEPICGLFCCCTSSGVMRVLSSLADRGSHCATVLRAVASNPSLSLSLPAYPARHLVHGELPELQSGSERRRALPLPQRRPVASVEEASAEEADGEPRRCVEQTLKPRDVDPQ